MKTKNDRRLKEWQYWIEQGRKQAAKLPPEETDRDTLTPDNEKRSNWAGNALKGFALESGVDELKFTVADLLADLGHFCDRHGVDMQWCLKIAASNYGAETDHKGAQFTEVS